MLEVERWAEIRRMSRVERLSQREIARRTGLNRRTIRRALEAAKPPNYGRPKGSSKLDPFKDEIERLLEGRYDLSGVRILEEIQALGYTGGKSILNEFLAEIRPRFAPPPRTFQHTVYRRGELIQFDLMELREKVPVGWGQSRRGYLLTGELPYSKMLCAALIFSKRFEDIAWGMNECLGQLGALPEKVVIDREGALHKSAGRPSDNFAAWLGELSLGWIILAPRDPQAKGALERSHRYLHGNFEAGRSFANPLDFQDQLNRWLAKANARKHRKTGQMITDHFQEEKASMKPLPNTLPGTDHQQVIRVPAQPYLRFDSNDYSLDPRLVGRRVELRASQDQVLAVELDTGEIACRHTRIFAKGLTFTDPAHQAALDEMRAERLGYRPRPKDTEVEIRSLERYDQLLSA
ncbi:MAG: IS21 family transposase [Thermoleophilia bacterium]|nr:IS21 family transposase [Thermoleophilia bacterium]